MSPVDPRSIHPRPPYPEQAQDLPGHEASLRPDADHGEESYRGSGRLDGYATIVTGADSGIGRAIAIAFAREGADVLVSYLSEHGDASTTMRHVEEAGRRALAMPGDIGDEAQCRRIVDRAVEVFGRVDVLVNNAGVQVRRESIVDVPTDEWERTLRTNLGGMFWLSRAALPHMRPGGSVINTSSIQASRPSANLLAYATTKGGIVTFTKALAAEVADRGIRVNAVAPGPVWTPLVVATSDPDHNAAFGGGSLVGRAAQPAELAPAYVYLASPAATFVTGSVLAVTGGEFF